MIEVCWAPMLAAFSVPIDQSDDEVVIALCLEGFRYAIHVTAVMSMKTHRDAFVTSLAKFTSLHSPADIKQKNIDAIKVGISPALTDAITSHDKTEDCTSATTQIAYVSVDYKFILFYYVRYFNVIGNVALHLLHLFEFKKNISRAVIHTILSYFLILHLSCCLLLRT